MHYWGGGGGGGGGGAVGFWPGRGVLSASGPGGGGGGVPSGKEGKGGALYYMNGFTTAPGICPCVSLVPRPTPQQRMDYITATWK